MRTRLLVCGLDNTLYDWVYFFTTSFYSMVDAVCRITGCNRETLLDDFRAVHRHYGDTEHPFSLLETKTIRQQFHGMSRDKIAEELNEALHAFNSSRKRTLKLYPGVREGLDVLEAAGVTLVAHTESNLFAVVDRLSRLDLTRYFSRICCRERAKSTHPNTETGRRWLDKFPMHKVTELSHHQRKPDPSVLLEICADEGASTAETAYVGDSIARDIAMAKKVGVFAIWAKYGSAHAPDAYDRLVRVTHWTNHDVHRELRLKKESEGIVPDCILENSFLELLPALGLSTTHTASSL